MAVEPIYEKIALSGRKTILANEQKVQLKCSIKADEITEILSVTATAGITSKECIDGQIKYLGKTVFYVCYQDGNGNIRKSECTADFSGAENNPLVKEGYPAFVCAEVIKTDYDLSGINLTAYAVVSVSIDFIENSTCDALSSGDGLITDNKDVSVIKSFGLKEGVYPIEEEFELSYSVKEVLFHKADVAVSSVSCGVGSVIVDGQVYLTVIVLQNKENCDIIKENRTIPFRMEIECEDATPTMRAVAKVDLRSIKTDVEVDDERGTSKVVSSINLIGYGEAFFEDSVTVAVDAFSINHELELTKEKMTCYNHLDVKSFTANVSGRAGIGELPIGVTLFAVAGEKAEVLSSNLNAGVLTITGVVTATGYFADDKNKVFTRKLETTFEKSFETEIFSECDEYELSVKAVKGVARLYSATEIDFDVELAVILYPKQRYEIDCIKEVKTLSEKQICDHAISVYIPLEGEEMWSLAKRLNVCPETLAQLNADLTFPLKGDERIVVYRQG